MATSSLFYAFLAFKAHLIAAMFDGYVLNKWQRSIIYKRPSCIHWNLETNEATTRNLQLNSLLRFVYGLFARGHI